MTIYKLGDTTKVIENILGDELELYNNITRPNKVFYHSRTKFVKIITGEFNDIENHANKICTLNHVFKKYEFFSECDVHRIQGNLVLISDILDLIYNESANGNWDSRKYLNEELIENGLIGNIKKISNAIWSEGYVHNDILKSVGVKNGALKIFDVDCMMGFETFKRTREFSDVYNSKLDRDYIFFKNFVSLFGCILSS